jgi:predicted ATPase/class 3 adenylate cyclase
MSEYPTGTVTFLLTDVQGSTGLWEQHADLMGAAMARHDAIIVTAVETAGGMTVRPRGEGDSRFAVFANVVNAVRAVSEIQRKLVSGFEDFPFALKVRAGLHTGAAEWREGDYYGSAVNRCARIRGLAHGGQTLLSQATAELVRDDLPDGATLVEMGTHRLKGLSRPETIFQLWLPGLDNDFPPLESAEGFLTNLPRPPAELIGREREKRELTAMLIESSARLVTLTGPGGTGKTRLSLEVGHRLHGSFHDGAFFVDLASISDPALVMPTIAHTLGIREGGDRSPFDNLKDFLAGRETLLILDNLEQIIAVAPAVAQLLAVAPKIKLLATSRIPLQIRGEREYPLATLPVPAGDSLSLDELTANEAVQLFVRRAQATRPAFELTADNATAIAAICRRLDGLPLAIEIAAARIRMLPPPALLKRLDQSLNLLTGGAADLPTRQQTMRGAIDWSYQLLQSPDQALFARLGVFVGGFTLANAESIANADGQLDVFTGIEALLNNSLLRPVESVTDEPRFDMLQTIRDYALDQLAQSGELAELRRIHAEQYANEVVVNWLHLYGPRAVERLAYLEEEHDNYRAAIAWGLEPGHDIFVSSQICVAHFWFWYRHGHLHEGREWAEKVVRATEGTSGHARVLGLISAAVMAIWQGDMKVADHHYEALKRLLDNTQVDEIVSMAYMTYGVSLVNQGRDREAYSQLSMAAERVDQEGDQWSKCTTLVHLANASLGLGQIKQAETWLQEALPMAQQIGDVWQIAFCLNNFGEVARVQGNYEKAKNYYLESEALYREADAVGDHARLIHTLGFIALHDGDAAQAEANFRESLAAFRKLGNQRGIAESLSGLAGVAVVTGESAWATPLLSAADARMVSSGAAWWPADRVELERTRQRLREALGEAEYARLWAQGQGMSLEEAIAYARDSITPPDATPPESRPGEH